MDMAREEVRNLNYNEFTETKSLEHASQQARQRNYQDFLRRGSETIRTS